MNAYQAKMALSFTQALLKFKTNILVSKYSLVYQLQAHFINFPIFSLNNSSLQIKAGPGARGEFVLTILQVIECDLLGQFSYLG